MKIFTLIRLFQKSKGRSPSPSELADLKKQAMEMTQKETNIIPFKYKKGFGEEVDELIEKGDVTIGTAPKTTKKKPSIDPKFKRVIEMQEDRAKIIKEFELRNKENAYKSAFRKYKELVDKKPMDSEGVLNIYRNLAKYPKGREIILGDITEIEKGLMFNTMGNRSREKLASQLNKIYSESPPKNPFEEVKVSDQLEMNFDDFDPKGMAGGGLAYMLGEGDVSRTPAKIGGLMKMLQALSAKSPLQRYKDYLASVKRRSQEGDFKSLAPELGAVSAGGILVNRKMKKILEEGNEQQKERFLQEFIEELDKDPFYKKYPDMKDKAIEKYTERMFGENRADGGRVPMMYGGDPGFAFEYGGSWADWNDNHKHMMPLMEYIGTKLPKDRMPFRNDRQGYEKGGMSRRGFLKLMGGLASIPILGKFFKLATPATKAVKAVKASNAAGMPAWFPKLVDKVIKDGKDVTKQYGTIEREIVHIGELPNSKTKIMVTQDLTTGDTAVDIGMGKHGWADGRHGQPTRLELTKGEWTTNKQGKGVKTKDEFFVEEAEFTGDAESVKFEDSVIESYGNHASDFSELELYATGKNVDKKIVGSKRAADDFAQGRAEMQAEQAAEEIDNFASGGVAKLLGE